MGRHSVALVVFVVALVGCGRMGFEARVGASPEPGPEVGEPLPPPPPGSVRLTYIATIAECIDPASPDLARCFEINGPGQLVVDGNDGTTESPWESYLRFDLDDALAGKTILDVRLEMTATDDDKADGPDSGDVWQVDAFDLGTLESTAPLPVGEAPIASSRGSVDTEDVVQWGLQTTLVAPRASVFLGVITTDDSGGVNYWNLEGRSPPRLVVDAI